MLVFACTVFDYGGSCPTRTIRSVADLPLAFADFQNSGKVLLYAAARHFLPSKSLFLFCIATAAFFFLSPFSIHQIMGISFTLTVGIPGQTTSFMRGTGAFLMGCTGILFSLGVCTEYCLLGDLFGSRI